MSQHAALACAVVRQALDDLEIYLRALQRNNIRLDDIGTIQHEDVLYCQRETQLPGQHRNAVCAAMFLTGTTPYENVTKMWFEASGLDFLKCREKAEAMFPLRQLLAM